LAKKGEIRRRALLASEQIPSQIVSLSLSLSLMQLTNKIE
jgi:hypothetical protein